MSDKYKEFDKLIAQAVVDKVEYVIVAQPWVLGDNYEEIISNLNKIAFAGLKLCIVEPNEK